MIKVTRWYRLGILLEMLIYNPKKYKGRRLARMADVESMRAKFLSEEGPVAGRSRLGSKSKSVGRGPEGPLYPNKIAFAISTLLVLKSSAEKYEQGPAEAEPLQLLTTDH